ncbi:MAG TPA: lipoyl(octanoyl) transferase LipB [Candidatus Binatus sp.]|nr:lipoyl(octanoyl) transferase LipB [Candidatus Binatus sp.]
MTRALFEDLGRIRYKDAWDLQLRLHAERVADARPDTLLFCEHEPVLTMGKSGKGQNLLVSQDELRRRGVEYYEIERGGDLTYHGPGQLVAYPIFKLPRLREVQAFVRKMERAINEALATFGIEAQQRPDHAGAFVHGAKIASIGAAVRSGVTYHGLALDVCTDLSYFQLINPCGMPGVSVTSIARELGREVTVQDAKSPLLQAMKTAFDLDVTSQAAAS